MLLETAAELTGNREGGRGELGMQSGNCCLLCSALEMDGRSHSSWKHSWDCSSGTLALPGGWEGKTCEGSLETLISNRIPYSHLPWATCSQVWDLSKEFPSFTYLRLRIFAQTRGRLCLWSGSSAFFSLISMTFCHVPFDVRTASAQLQPHGLRRQRKMCCAHRIA